jgi:uncharacterized protein (DUF4415 family)
MKKEYNFETAKVGPGRPAAGKTRITIMLDNDILDAFRARAIDKGTGYQTMINESLRAGLKREQSRKPPSEAQAEFETRLNEALRALLDAGNALEVLKANDERFALAA